MCQNPTSELTLFRSMILCGELYGTHPHKSSVHPLGGSLK